MKLGLQLGYWSAQPPENHAELVAETLGWIRYDLPDHLIGVVWHGRWRGQEQKWFAARFTGNDGDIDLEADHHPEFRAWRWAALAELPDLIVPFKRPLYVSIVTAFAHIGKPYTNDLKS